MNSPIKLAKSTKELHKNGNFLQTRHEDFADGGVDTLICSGDSSWQVPVKCSMAGYGMFMASWLFNMGKYIGFVQLYEHSRGGHRDPSVTLIDWSGTPRGTVYRYAGDFEIAAFDDNKLWLLHTDARQYRSEGLANFTGSCLMQIDLATGIVEKETPIQVTEKFIASQHLSHGWLTTIGLSALDVRFSQPSDQVMLEVSVVNYQRDKGHTYGLFHIPLAEFIP